MTAVLPELVRAYVERNAPPVDAGRVRLTQVGEMELKPGRRIPFRANQEIAVEHVAFTWEARFRLAPLVSLRVRDWCREGEGGLSARLFGLIRVVHGSGPEVARGEAMRYLAELPLAPQAMLRNPALIWRELDDSRVEVSTLVGASPVAVELRFGAGGDIVEAYAADRPRGVGKDAVPTPWLGTFGDYGVLGGVRLPTTAAVAWLLPEGPQTYFRGRITGLELG